MKLYLKLLKYMKPYWMYAVGALICIFLYSAANVVIIPLVGQLSKAIADKNFSSLNTIIFLGLFVFFLRAVLSYGQMYLMAFVAQRVVTDMRVQVYKHIQDQSLDFFSKWKTGEIMSRIMNDITIVQAALVSSTTDIIPHSLTLIGVIGYLFYLNWRLTALTLVLTPIFIFTVAKFGSEIRSIGSQIQKKTANITSILQETLSGIRVVKSFTMEKPELEKFKKESEDNFWLSMIESSITATQQPLMGFLQVLAVLFVVWYGGLEVLNGRLSANNLIAFFTGTALLIDPIIVLSRVNITIQRSLASTQRVFEIFDTKPSVIEKENPIVLTDPKGNVEFKNVTFKYDNMEIEALENLNLNIKSGEIIALVGPSGAGKSTFVNLIPRFYDTTRGRIYIDGNDIRDLTLLSLRKNIGIVPQETILFSGTIKENIAYGKIDATEEEIIRAAKIANAHNFIIDLPDSYNSYVGERGCNLSGGEKQRIAIARAVLRNPRILILDEATSSLDTESEKLVQEAMEKLMKGRTTFIIAHRLSTINYADRIVVLNKGKIVEIGNHQQLVSNNGLYQKLYEMQFRDEEVL